MDEDGGGVSDLELAWPLIALGLATNTGFVRKVMRILAPSKFSGDSSFEDNQLTVREFSTLFRSDPTSEKIVATIKQELKEEMEASGREAKALTVKNTKHMKAGTEHTDSMLSPDPIQF